MWAALTSESGRASYDPTSRSHSCSAPADKTPWPQPTALFFTATRHNACFSLMLGFSSLTAHGIIQTRQLHSSTRIRGRCMLLLLQTLPSPTLLFHSVIEGNPWVVLHDMWCLLLPGFEYLLLEPAVDLICWWSHLISINTLHSAIPIT